MRKGQKFKRISLSRKMLGWLLLCPLWCRLNLPIVPKDFADFLNIARERYSDFATRRAGK